MSSWFEQLTIPLLTPLYEASGEEYNNKKRKNTIISGVEKYYERAQNPREKAAELFHKLKDDEVAAIAKKLKLDTKEEKQHNINVLLNSLFLYGSNAQPATSQYTTLATSNAPPLDALSAVNPQQPASPVSPTTATTPLTRFNSWEEVAVACQNEIDLFTKEFLNPAKLPLPNEFVQNNSFEDIKNKANIKKIYNIPLQLYSYQEWKTLIGDKLDFNQIFKHKVFNYVHQYYTSNFSEEEFKIKTVGIGEDIGNALTGMLYDIVPHGAATTKLAEYDKKFTDLVKSSSGTTMLASSIIDATSVSVLKLNPNAKHAIQQKIDEVIGKWTRIKEQARASLSVVKNRFNECNTSNSIEATLKAFADTPYSNWSSFESGYVYRLFLHLLQCTRAAQNPLALTTQGECWWDTALHAMLIDAAFLDTYRTINLNRREIKLQSSYHAQTASKYKLDALFRTKQTSIEIAAIEASLKATVKHSREDVVKLAKEGACIQSHLRGSDSHNQIIPLMQAIETQVIVYCITRAFGDAWIFIELGNYHIQEYISEPTGFDSMMKTCELVLAFKILVQNLANHQQQNMNAPKPPDPPSNRLMCVTPKRKLKDKTNEDESTTTSTTTTTTTSTSTSSSSNTSINNERSVGEDLTNEYTLVHGFILNDNLRVIFAKHATFREVAIKIVAKNRGQSEVCMLTFIQEQAISHGKQNIITLLDTYAPQTNLVALVFPRLLPIDTSLNMHQLQLLSYHIFCGLQYLDQCGIVHSDISPGNIMINPSSNEATIIDFGSAMYGPYVCKHPCGTEGFMAPEMLENRMITTKADMFSAGAVLAYTYALTTNSIALHNVFGTHHSDFISVYLEALSLKLAEAENDKNEIEMALFDMLIRLACINSDERLDAQAALKHPFVAAVSTVTNIIGYVKFDMTQLPVSQQSSPTTCTSEGDGLYSCI